MQIAKEDEHRRHPPMHLGFFREPKLGEIALAYFSTGKPAPSACPTPLSAAAYPGIAPRGDLKEEVNR